MSQKILDYWFVNGENKFQRFWFSSKPETDKYVAETFGTVFHEIESQADEYEEWKQKPQSYLALIISLDQFSRHIYRSQSDTNDGSEKIKKCTQLAMQYATDLIAQGGDLQLPPLHRLFILLPFRHSKQLDKIQYTKAEIARYREHDTKEKETKKTEDCNLSEKDFELNMSFYDRFMRATEKQLATFVQKS